MERDGLLQRVPRFDPKYGQRSNEYHFDGLIKEAKPFAEEAIEERKKRQKENADRRTRKLPKLRVVKGQKINKK